METHEHMNTQKYNAWHVNHTEQIEDVIEEENYSDKNIEKQESLQMDEWKLFSQMGLANSVKFNELEMLGRCDFDINNKWENCSSQFV